MKGAPVGNEFWKLRSKHGRDKIFASPEDLWEAACEYFEAMTARTDWNQQDWVGKDGNEVVRNVRPPFLLISMFTFMGISKQTWDDYSKRKDFIDICTRIQNVIFAQKFEGAATGHYKESIIARELGLRDQQDIDHTTKGESMNGATLEELTKIAKRINKNAKR